MANRSAFIQTGHCHVCLVLRRRPLEQFFSALLYISDSDKWPLQVMLRQIVLLSQASVGDMANMDPNFVQPPEQSIKMAVIVVGTIPILLVYPFLQKHFAKGVMLGSIKG